MDRRIFKGFLKQSTLKMNRYIKDHYVDCDVDRFVSSRLVNRYDVFSLYRELNSRAYFITLPNIIVISLCKTQIEDFELLYEKSPEYLFDVYETERYYHIICVSKYSNGDISEWLYSNEANKKYLNLYKIYGSCLVVNKPWYYSIQGTPFQTKYTFLKSIGQGQRLTKLANLIKRVMNLINNEYKHLPNHYLSFP
jgi:hypothetical protein